MTVDPGDPDPAPADSRAVVVWGNCQAEPVATLLSEPLLHHGLRIVAVPPVFLVDEPGLARVHEILSTAAVLVTQPVRDEYSIPGCGAAQLSELLPADGRVVTFPVTYHVAAFPFQVSAHGADGGGVDAPLTDYHDLRIVVAAERGLTAEETLDWWPTASESAVRAVADTSLKELQRRETGLDVQTSQVVSGPGAMYTMNHPANTVLVEVVRQVLDVLGVAGDVTVPQREFLGGRRTPIEPAVAAALDWPAEAITETWVIDGKPVALREIVAAHLQLYRDRPDIVADCRSRYARRLDTLGLAPTG